jgi:hypothetical protein
MIITFAEAVVQQAACVQPRCGKHQRTHQKEGRSLLLPLSNNTYLCRPCCRCLMLLKVDDVSLSAVLWRVRSRMLDLQHQDACV